MIRHAVLPQQKEADFLGAVEDLADSLGWLWLHIDPALNDRGYWRTPIRGPLGPGWPDLFLIHRGKQRMIYAELKARYRKTTPQQDEVLGYLGEFGMVETYVWWPKDWEGIVECLSR